MTKNKRVTNRNRGNDLNVGSMSVERLGLTVKYCEILNIIQFIKKIDCMQFFVFLVFKFSLKKYLIICISIRKIDTLYNLKKLTYDIKFGEILILFIFILIYLYFSLKHTRIVFESVFGTIYF